MEGRELAYYEMVDLEQADQSIKTCLLDALSLIHISEPTRH